MKLITQYILSRYGGRVITKEELREVCERFGENFEYIVNYYISRGYLVRILRGVYYVKTLEEYKFGRTPDPMTLIAKAMNKLDLKWYFGLYTSLRLNGATYEYYSRIFLITPVITRPKPITVLGEEVQFVKLKESLLGFGVVKRRKIQYSDLEKTLLDFIYLKRYNKRLNADAVVQEYLAKAKKEKLMEYSKAYPKSVQREVEAIVSRQ
ncbi:type IV toxin-antitoxin system AbiEi family antitoxin domain-containing protein [Thermococcus prieurii]